MAEGGSERDVRTVYWKAKLAAQADVLDVVRHVQRGGNDFVLLDARDPDAYQRERLPGALSVPLDAVAEVVKDLPTDRQYVVYCWRSTCHLAAKVALQLAERGFDVKEMNSGWREWKAAGWPTEGPEAA
jgi:rhodanese-related sulfurtransferase